MSKSIHFDGAKLSRPGEFINQYLSDPFLPPERRAMATIPEIERRMAAEGGVHAAVCVTLPNGEIRVEVSIEAPKERLTKAERNQFENVWCEDIRVALCRALDDVKPAGCSTTLVLHKPAGQSAADAYVGIVRHLSREQLEINSHHAAADAWAKWSHELALELQKRQQDLAIVTNKLDDVVEFVNDLGEEGKVIADALKIHLQPEVPPSKKATHSTYPSPTFYAGPSNYVEVTLRTDGSCVITSRRSYTGDRHFVVQMDLVDDNVDDLHKLLKLAIRRRKEMRWEAQQQGNHDEDCCLPTEHGGLCRPFQVGDQVVVACNPDLHRNYRMEVRSARNLWSGNVGAIVERHSEGHGLCFTVQFTTADGHGMVAGVAYYDPNEMKLVLR